MRLYELMEKHRNSRTTQIKALKMLFSSYSDEEIAAFFLLST